MPAIPQFLLSESEYLSGSLILRAIIHLELSSAQGDNMLISILLQVTILFDNAICGRCSLFSSVYFWLLYLFIYLVFQDRVSLLSPGCLGTHSIDQADLELRDLPASASRVLGLKA